MKDILSALEWRYATKQFDSSKKIEAVTWSKIEDILVLTPSSFGLQPWKFLVITDQAMKEKLKAHSWNQAQVADCSHLVVLCRRTDIDESLINRFIEKTAKERGLSTGDLEGYKQMMLGALGPRSNEEKAVWAGHQVYIALGQAMTACAAMEVDTCPMEGFSSQDYDKELNLAEQNLASVVVLACGYRSEEDKYAEAKKVRFNKEEVIVRL